MTAVERTASVTLQAKLCEYREASDTDPMYGRIAMPWPFLFLAGAKVAGHAAAKAAATVGAKGAASAGAKGATSKSSGFHLPPGTKTIAKELAKRLGRRDVGDDNDRQDDKKE